MFSFQLPVEKAVTLGLIKAQNVTKVAPIGHGRPPARKHEESRRHWISKMNDDFSIKPSSRYRSQLVHPICIILFLKLLLDFYENQESFQMSISLCVYMSFLSFFPFFPSNTFHAARPLSLHFSRYSSLFCKFFESEIYFIPNNSFYIFDDYSYLASICIFFSFYLCKIVIMFIFHFSPPFTPRSL